MNRVNFTISISQTGDLPGVDYFLSVNVDLTLSNLCVSALQVESYVVYHGGIGDEIYPDEPNVVAAWLIERHCNYMQREAIKAAEIDAKRAAEETEHAAVNAGVQE